MALFKRFLKFVQPYRWLLAQALALLMITSLINVIRPWVIAVIFDRGLGAESGQAPNLRYLWQGVGLLVLTTLLAVGIGVRQSWVVQLVGQRVIFDIRRHLHKHLQKLSMSFYDSQQSGRIMARVMYDVDAIGNLTSGTLVLLISDTVTILFTVVVMFYLSWELALLALLIIPLYAINFLMARRRISKAYRRVREKVSEISGDLQEKISATKVVKSFTRERSESRRFVRHIRENMELMLSSYRLSLYLQRSGGLLTGLATAAIYLWGGYFVVRGIHDFTPGRLLQFSTYLGQLYGPAQRLIDSNDLVTRALVAVERIFEILDRRPDIEDKPDAVELPRVRGHVEFRNVSFGYDPEELVLQNINLDVQPGEMCAFVGPSGSGKTTLANLIARFYDPTSGQMMLDGVDLRDIKLAFLRRQIGIVLQETHLFTGTVRENLMYGNRFAANEAVIRAAMAANAHDFIMELPEDYDTEIGERGIKLSGGQRQRIAIARAILRDPRLLILDEATSALDSTSEALIQSALDRLMEGRTSFVIAHRLSTIMKADKIVVLENGIIVDVGSHSELLERGGLYAKLYNMQFRNQEGELEDADDEEPSPDGATTAGAGKRVQVGTRA